MNPTIIFLQVHWQDKKSVSKGLGEELCVLKASSPNIANKFFILKSFYVTYILSQSPSQSSSSSWLALSTFYLVYLFWFRTAVSLDSRNYNVIPFTIKYQLSIA